MGGLLGLEVVGGGNGGSQDVVAGAGEAADQSEVDKAALGATPGQHGDDVDRLGNHRARHGDDGFLDELFETAQRAERRTGVDGADAAWVAGAPGFQEVEGFGAAHLADGDAVRPQAERGAHEVR